MNIEDLKSELHKQIDNTISSLDEQLNKHGKIVWVNKVMNHNDGLFYCIVELNIEALFQEEDYGPSLSIILERNSDGQILLLYDIIKSNGPYIFEGSIELSTDDEVSRNQIIDFFATCTNDVRSALIKEYNFKLQT